MVSGSDTGRSWPAARVVVGTSVRHDQPDAMQQRTWRNEKRDAERRAKRTLVGDAAAQGRATMETEPAAAREQRAGSAAAAQAANRATSAAAMAAMHDSRLKWLTARPRQWRSTSGAALRAQRACSNAAASHGLLESAETMRAAPICMGGAHGGQRQRGHGHAGPSRAARQDAWARGASAAKEAVPSLAHDSSDDDAGAIGEREREWRARTQFGAATRPTWSKAVALTAAAKARVAERSDDSGRERAIAAMRDKRQAAMDTTVSENTSSGIDSAVRMWLEFCPIRGVDPDAFGQLRRDEMPRPSQLMEEDEILCDFAAYVVDHPRQKGLDHLLGNTAAQYVSRVLTWYEGRLQPPRRPGGAGGFAGANNALGHALRRTLKGLRKLHPANPERSRKEPVTRQHMLGIKRQLDLSKKFDSMVWAFCCTCWQGGRRSGDIIRGKAVKKPWAPQRDMHRGRVVAERGAGGRLARVVLKLPPGKTDPTGEEGHEAILPYAKTAEINAAAAIKRMLRLDPLAAGESPAEVALFRDTRPGKGGRPMTYGPMIYIVKRLLQGAGMTSEEAGCHSFRRGTATSLNHSGESDSIMRSIGIWGSNAMFGYVDITVGGAMERAMLRMAEVDVTTRATGRHGIG